MKLLISMLHNYVVGVFFSAPRIAMFCAHANDILLLKSARAQAEAGEAIKSTEREWGCTRKPCFLFYPFG